MADISEFKAKVDQKFPHGVQITYKDMDLQTQITDVFEVEGFPAILGFTQAKDIRIVVKTLSERGDRWVVTEPGGEEAVLVPLTKEQGAILSDVLENQP